MAVGKSLKRLTTVLQNYRKIARALSPAIFLELAKLAEIDGVAIGFKVSF